MEEGRRKKSDVVEQTREQIVFDALKNHLGDTETEVTGTAEFFNEGVKVFLGKSHFFDPDEPKNLKMHSDIFSVGFETTKAKFHLLLALHLKRDVFDSCAPNSVQYCSIDGYEAYSISGTEAKRTKHESKDIFHDAITGKTRILATHVKEKTGKSEKLGSKRAFDCFMTILSSFSPN